MTIPLLLLALYFGVLAISLGLGTWVGLAAPPPQEVRRVSDAVERASLRQLIVPAKWAAGLVLLICALSGTDALLRKESVLWALLGPVIGVLAAGSSLYYGTRRIHRATGQVVASTHTNSVVLLSRALLSAVLLAGATAGTTAMGLHLWVSHEVSPAAALRVVLFTNAAVGAMALCIARVSAIATLTAHRGVEALAQPQPRESLSHLAPAPHPGSLALLVGDSFHAPLLRLSLWLVFAGLGHCTLMLAEENAAAGTWLYPHLLLLLGMFALTFGALVVRLSEGEPLSHGWLRGGLVTLTLLVAGAWSMSSRLPQELSRSIPAGLTFFFISLGIFVALNTNRENATGLLATAARRAPAALALLALVLALFLAVPSSADAKSIAPALLARLVVAGAVAAFPLGITWSLAAHLESCRKQTADLAFLPGQIDHTPWLQMRRLMGLSPLLSLLVSFGSLRLFLGQLSATPETLFLGLGLTIGLVSVLMTAGLLEAGTEQGTLRIRELLAQGDSAAIAGNLNLEDAANFCGEAIVGRPLQWLLAVLAPATVALALRTFMTGQVFAWAALGLGLGLALFGAAHAWLSAGSTRTQEKLFGTTSLVTGLAQILFLLVVVGTI